MYTGCIPRRPRVRHGVGVGQRRRQSRALQGLDFVARRPLDRVEDVYRARDHQSRVAAELRHDHAVGRYGYIVQCRPPLTRPFRRDRRQSCAGRARAQVGDGAVASDRRVAIRFAGVRKRQVCECEHEPAMADAVAIQHGGRDGHADKAAPAPTALIAMQSPWLAASPAHIAAAAAFKPYQ